ncbi:MULTISPECIES: DUF3108 domain-containing protein [unclassified Methylophilus]|uniref:DUF3108 domain-containing protein n=1 Tax=unclassified Methylophilus TaxID=2630143 RepID=UPI00189088A8|nr:MULTISPECIES: DUF3108 domain-containing protein [unclassified Methylophilus]MBF5040709.1 DUF3108 domain-containing protein [Methylophilus sp. 13]MDF0377968.1 DUF3108 domain-containing protein [Methylophilus sp. YYY-1]
MPASGLREKITQHFSWPLFLAFCVSLLLHVLVLSEVNWRSWLPAEAEQPARLQARLVLPTKSAPVASKVEAPASRPAPAAKKRSSAQPLSEPATDQGDRVAPDALSESSSADVSQSGQDAPAVPEAEAVAEQIAEWHASDHPEATDDERPAPPYRHVLTEYAVYVNGESRPAGSASIEYVRETAESYSLRWLVEGKGLLKLLYPSLEQQSRGEVGPAGLRPSYYRYAFGSRESKTYEATFNWAIGELTLKTSKGEQKRELPANTQDILSFMYQFMFVPPLQEMRVTLTNGRRLGEYEYVFEGEETLEIAEQSVSTLHIAHTRGDTDEKVELWLASGYRYVPVKIKKLEKNGMVIEQVATRLIAE